MLTRTINLYRSSFSGLSKDMWLLAMVTLINRAGTMVVPFLTVYLTQELHFTKGQAGWVMSFFGLGSVVGTYVGGQLTDRIGYYPVQFWSLFLSGVMFILLSKVSSFPMVCAMIFLLSVIADSFRPANFASVAAYSRPENRTRSYSLLRLAVNLGFAAGPAIGGLLAALKGYQLLFWVDGLTCISAALVFRIFLKYKKEPDEETPAAGAPLKFSSAYRDRIFLVFVFLIFLSAVAFMQLFSTMPVFYKEHFLLGEGRIGLLLAFNGLLVAMMEMPLVYTLDGRTSKLQLAAGGALLIGISYFVFLVFPDWAWVVWPAMAIITFGEIFNMPFANAFALDRSTPRNRGQYMALYSMVYSVALIIAPALGLQIAERLGFFSLWVVLTSLCLASFAGLLALERNLRKR
jgi:predicted MFS family arabinose efflux permease